MERSFPQAVLMLMFEFALLVLLSTGSTKVVQLILFHKVHVALANAHVKQG